MAYVIRFSHHLEIDGVPLSTPAWEHQNIQGLYASAEVRGENRVMPGARGRRALPWRPDETMRTLTLAIFGDLSWDGTKNADAEAGLWANVAHLQTFIVDNPLNADSTRTAVIKRTGVPDLIAKIQVRGFEIDDESYSPAAIAASMDIALLSGAFAS
jgi:hypothetical protein